MYVPTVDPAGFSTDYIMKLNAILLIVLSIGPSLIAETTGSVCVLPNPSESPTRISPGGEYNPATLMVKIDKKEALHWPHHDGLVIDGLNIGVRHRMVLYSDNKPIQSFWFRFSEYETNRIQVSFDRYQGVQMHGMKALQSYTTKEKR
jgi:hypothetical protein